MASVQKSLRIPRRIAEEIEDLGAEGGLDFSGVANQLLEEAVRMRRCPGVVFRVGPSGRRATVAGTGIDVWEIIATYHAVGRAERRLQKSYHWLTEPQLRAALAYYRLYPDEIDERLGRDGVITPEALRRRFPALAARRPDRARARG
jgi:uncharacterized protein (DUF433 family)